MYDGLSAHFLPTLRQAHASYVRVDAFRDGTQLGLSDGLSADYVKYGLPLDTGQVSVNSGTGVRRTLDVTISDVDLWDVLSVIGTELKPQRGIRYPNSSPEAVPLGMFGIDQAAMSVAPGGGIGISSAPDRWARVQRARFEAPAASIKGATHKSEIARLLDGAIPSGTVTTTATSTATVGALVWERDRDQAIVDLSTAIGAETYLDWTGAAVIRDVPLLSAGPVWTVDASPSGVLLGGDRSRDRTRTYNVVVVSASSIDGSAPFAPQTVEDDDATSPTYVGGDMGRVPYFYSSPLVATAGQALAAGATLLNRLKGQAAQLNVESAVNPALDRGDVIYVVLPNGTTERHLIESLTVPLVGNRQTITTRSSRPEGDVPAEE